VSESDVRAVLAAPDRVDPVREGRVVAQKIFSEAGEPRLLRVFVDVDRDPAEVVTVYRTSKIKKYGGR